MSVNAPRDETRMGPVRRAITAWWRGRPRWQAADQAAAIEATRWLRPLASDNRHPYGGGR